MATLARVDEQEPDTPPPCLLVLINFMLTRNRLESSERTEPTEKMPPWDWAVGNPVGHFLN